MHPFTPFTTLPNPSPNSGKEIIYSLYLWMFYFVLFHFLSWQRIHLHCRRPQFYSWVRKICWRRERLPTLVFLGFPCGSAGKESACNVEDLDSFPGLGRSPGEGKGYSLQYSGLKISMDFQDLQRLERDWVTFTFNIYCRVAYSIKTIHKFVECPTHLNFWGSFDHTTDKINLKLI